MKMTFLLSLCFIWLTGADIDRHQDDEAAIRSVMAQQVKCWNDADIDCFMEGYWNSENLVFIGSSGPTYGWQTTLDNYRKRYPDKASMGELKFDIISIDLMGDEHAFVVGKWALKRSIGDVSGHYTLLWQKIDGKWVIIKDHTS